MQQVKQPTTTMQAFFAVALSPPLRVKEVADYVDLDVDTVSRALKDMPDAERFGSFWQVPVRKMGPKFWKEHGLIPEHNTDEDPLDTDECL